MKNENYRKFFVSENVNILDFSVYAFMQKKGKEDRG